MTIEIWLSSLDDPDPMSGRDSFSDEELARAEGMVSSLRRRRFLNRRWMARAVLSRATGSEPGTLVVERRCKRCGRLHPVSPIAGEAGEVWWSASSSAGLGAIAISPRRVGLDVERRRERRRWKGIARRRYTQAEQRAVAESPGRFLELWTLKEAYLKALGEGLAGGLGSLDCAHLSRSLDDWMESGEHPGWRFRRLQPQPDVFAALAVEGVPETIEVRRLPTPTR